MRRAWGGVQSRRLLVWVFWVSVFVCCFVLSMFAASTLVYAVRALGGVWSVETTLGSLIFRLTMYVAMAGLFVGIPLLMTRRYHPSLQTFGIGRGLRFGDIGLALAGVVIYLLMTVVVQVMLRAVPGYDASQSQDLGVSTSLVGTDLLVTYLVLVVLTPFFEELLFRGMLQGELRRRHMSKWVAIIVVSVLFGVAHGQWNVGLDVFCLSIVAAYLRELTGTIWPGVILHIIKNAVAFWFVFIVGQSITG